VCNWQALKYTAVAPPNLLHGFGYEECGLQFFILLQVIHHTLYPNIAKESGLESGHACRECTCVASLHI
jgi:hypothetical protein